MRRIFFTSVAVLSLLVCAICSLAWIRSYSEKSPEFTPDGWPHIVVEAIDGRFFLLHRDFAQFPMLHIQLPPGTSEPRYFARGKLDLSRSPGQPIWHRHGFGWIDGLFQGKSYRGLMVPCWLPVLLTAILPGAWIKAHLRRLRRRWRGLCVRCGYDLRASTERCPECGTRIPKGWAHPH